MGKKKIDDIEIEETSSEEEVEIEESSSEDEDIEIEETSSEEEVEIEESSSEDEDIEIEETSSEDEDISIPEGILDYDLTSYSENSDSSSLSNELKLLGDVIFKGEKYNRYEKAIKDKVPYSFIFKSGDKIINLLDEIDSSKNIVENYNKILDMGIKVSPKDFIMLFYIKNKGKSKKFLIDNFNMLNEIANLEKFYIQNFDSYINNFNQRFNILIEKTEKDFKNFEKFYNKIENFKTNEKFNDVLDTFSIDTTTVEYDIKDGEYFFDKENMEIIFNNLSCNGFFSYIRLNKEKNSYYKIFTGGNKKYENFVDLNDTIDFESYKLYLFYEFDISNKYIMDYVKIDLLKSSCFINYIGETLSVIKDEMRKIVPDLKFLEEKEKNISGDFEMIINNYNETKLYYLTLFSDIFSEFLYIKEDISVRSLKENIKFYYVGTEQYRQFLNYSIYFNIKKLYNNKYLIDFTSKISSPKLIKEFILILLKLFWYFDNLPEQELKYLSFVENQYTGPDGDGLGGNPDNIEIAEDKSRTKKIENLMLKEKDLFQKRIYVRSCPCVKQPVIINPEDKEDWENYKLNGKKRNVVLFPPQKSSQKVSKNYYVCPDDEFTTFSLKENPDLRSKYPLIPCCNISNFPEDLYRDYDKIRENPTKYWSSREMYRGKNKSILKTLKILKSEREGIVPDYITKFLGKVENRNFIREGIYMNSKSSLIHCCIKAFNGSNFISENQARDKNLRNLKKYSDDYMKLSIEKRDNKIRNLRVNINKFTKFYNINVSRQELYDFRNEEVLKLMSNPEYNLNSEIFFKFFETMFVFNIFVFVYDKDLDKTYLEIPNYQDFHIRLINDTLPCIFLLRHKRRYAYDVYELIREEENKNNYIFDKKYTKYMKKYIEKNNSYYIKKDEVLRKNCFNNINWNIILKDYKIVSQMINSSGRTFSVSFIYNSKGGKVTIFTQSTAPLVCENTTKIYEIDKKTCIKLFGKNYKKGSQGLWYPINDIEFGFFVPCSDIELSQNYICKDYLIIKDKDIRIAKLDNIKICKKNSSIYLQLIKWLYFLEDSNLEDWFSKNIVLDNSISKEALVSRQFNIPLRFPTNIKNFKEGIKYLNQYIPEIFNKKIYLYEKLYHSTYRNLSNFIKSNDGIKIKNSNVINDVLIYETDFLEYDFNKILLGSDYNSWKEKISKANENINIIEEDYIFQQNPFVWKNKNTGRIYLFYNNLDNSLIISLMCCKINELFINTIPYETTLKNVWKTIKVYYDRYNFGWTFEKLKEYIYIMTDKKLYFKDEEKCLTYLEKNNIPFKMEEQYSYIVYGKKGDNITIIREYIIDDKQPLEVYMFLEGGYGSLIDVN